MNKDPLIINAGSWLETYELDLLQTWFIQYFRMHEKATPMEVSRSFRRYLEKIYIRYMYSIFHNADEYHFVKQIDSVWEGDDDWTPIYALDEDIKKIIIYNVNK